MGSNLKTPIVGASPSLDVGPKDDLEYAIDFRRVYATILDQWFECPHEKILEGQFEHLNFI